MTFKVVVTDCDLGSLEHERAELEQAGATLIDGRGLPLDALLETAREADALLVQWMSISDELLRGLPRCRAISRYGIGVDMIDLRAASANGVHVFNVADYCIDEVATHTLTLLLALNRQLTVLTQIVHNGQWTSSGLPPIRRLRDQVLGVIGFGRIGQAVVRKAQGVGLTILVHDPYTTTAQAEAQGMTTVSLQELLTTSDYVSLHCPLTPQTRHMIGSAELEQMKPGAYLINVSRGPLIDEDALLAALTHGSLAGAALDVLEHEPPTWGHPVLQQPNIIVTPHAAYHSSEALVELQRSAAQNLIRFFTGKELRNLVNPQVQSAHPSARIA